MLRIWMWILLITNLTENHKTLLTGDLNLQFRYWNRCKSFNELHCLFVEMSVSFLSTLFSRSSTVVMRWLLVSEFLFSFRFIVEFHFNTRWNWFRLNESHNVVNLCIQHSSRCQYTTHHQSIKQTHQKFAWIYQHDKSGACSWAKLTEKWI